MRIFYFLIIITLALSSIAESAAQDRLLNCERYDGEQEFHIYINESEGFVIYNAPADGSYERLQDVPISNSVETTTIDFGIDITSNCNPPIYNRVYK